MSIYNGEKVEYFRQSMESVLNQTLKADEIILIRDGKVYKELQDCIDYYVNNFKEISYYPFDENKGLGNALNYGVGVAKNELIFRMDTDDIAVKDRFEKQYNYLSNNPDIAVLGGQIYEFIDTPNSTVAKRDVPISNEDIYLFFKSRNAFNHMTVAFRKSIVLEAGNYQELHYLEDYYLWSRMVAIGAKFHNLEDVLVYARIGEDMYRRRGGIKYFRAWRMLLKYKLRNKQINFLEYIKTLTVRFVVQVLMTNQMRGWVLKKFSRKGVSK